MSEYTERLQAVVCKLTAPPREFDMPPLTPEQQAESDKRQRWMEATLEQVRKDNRTPFAQMMADAMERQMEREALGIFEGDFKVVKK